MQIEYRKTYGKWFATDVLRTIRSHGMIAPGEHVCVGLSGGKDSVTLLYILAYLRRHSSLRFEVSALHVRTASYDTSILRDYCQELGVPYLETGLETSRPAVGRVCAICARLKRGAAARLLARQGIRTLAYGHHADDRAETLLMNLVQHGRLETFPARLQLPGERVAIVRPLVLLAEQTVAAIHRRLQLPLLAYECPYAERNVRGKYKAALRLLEESVGARGLARRVAQAVEAGRAGSVADRNGEEWTRDSA